MLKICRKGVARAAASMRLSALAWLFTLLWMTAISAVEITESQPSGVGQTAATLRVLVGPVVQAGTVHFVYGPAFDDLGNSTASRVLNASSSDTLVSVFVSGLQCGSNYFYAAKVNADGVETASSIYEFSTNPCINSLAALELLPAENINENAARISGAIDLDKEYQSVSYYFKYGETTAYGLLSDSRLINAKLTSRRVMSQDLFNLTCATQYHYQMIADFVEKDTGLESSLQSEDLTFTTLDCQSLKILSSSLVSQGTDLITVTAAVDTQGLETEVYFQYGEARDALLQKTESYFLNYGSVTATIKNLDCGTVYYFNVVASNTLGQASSEAKQSATMPCSLPPTAITQDVSEITSDGAIIRANVFPNESPTEIYFEYGKTLAFESQSSTATIVGGFTGQIVQETLSALECATLYYFRILARNENGLSTGESQSFVTADCESQNQPPITQPPEAEDTILRVFSGATHSFAIGPGGTAISWGENRDSQLGGLSSNIRVVDGIENLQNQLLLNIADAAGGDDHSLILFKNGSVQAFGSNLHGQLGVASDINNISNPMVVRYENQAELASIVDVSAGGFHSTAVRDDGVVLVWGRNTKGQLANNTIGSSTAALEVEGISEVIAVEAGKEFVVALLQSKILMSWGANESGQLGNGSFDSQAFPVVVNVVVGAVSHAAGAKHVLAVHENGSVYAWGNNERGQLGQGDLQNLNEASPVVMPDGEPLGNVVKVVAGANHSVALLDDGTLMAWGSNVNGQLGTGDEGNRLYPGPVLNGSANSGAESQLLTGIVDIAAGDNFTIAVSEKGSIYGWGENLQGQVNGRVTGSRVGLINLTNASNSVISLLTPRLVANINRLEIRQGGAARIGIRLSADPQNVVEVNALINSSDAFVIDGESSLRFDSSNWYQDQFINVQASTGAQDGDGSLVLTTNGYTSLNIELSTESDSQLKPLQQVAGAIAPEFLLLLLFFLLPQFLGRM